MHDSASIFREAQRRHMAGDRVGAVSLYRRLLKAHARDPALLHQLGSVLMSLGETAEGREHLLKAIRINPREPIYQYDLGLCYKREGRLVEARRAFTAGLRVAPEHAILRSALADLDATEGRWEIAYQQLKPLVEALAPAAAIAQVFARVCSRLQRNAEAAEVLHRALNASELAPPIRAGLLFARASALEACGNYDAAFAAARDANALRQVAFDPALHTRRISQVIRAWSADIVQSMPRATTASRRAVFIVGMPRSGTSLVEQILAAHPDVFGAGELNDVGEAVHELEPGPPDQVPLLSSPTVLTKEIVNSLSQRYLEHLKRLAPRAVRVTDKMPLNCLHLGLVAAILPRASVIHCVRDAQDTCISCYFQHFGGNNPFAYDLEHLGQFHRDYARLMEHWRGVIDLPMLEIRYEDLVADIPGQTQRMLQFLELKWNDACVHFHASKRVVQTASRDQVTQPVYDRSIGRHAHYTGHLEPLRRGLGMSNDAQR